MRHSEPTSSNYSTPRGSETEEPIDMSNSPYIPLLDDPIEEAEVVEAAETCKEAKSFIGVTPAIFSCLPPIWITFVTQILNMVFLSDNFSFPLKWCYNKLIVLFKKGARLICGNYRGISIGDTLGKVYAKILGNRLKQWMDIDSCQAGGQEERGCGEHILALRLIFDYAISEKVKLFVLFIDFSKAYDKVPRKTLFEILKKLGCGKRFLSALVAIYKNTVNILNTEYVRATIGVKQGGPMSCILFIIYLNILAVTIRALGPDSFLNDIHALMLMDDTVLLASTRERMIEKFTVLMNFCKKYGMFINESKTQMMVVNGTKGDRSEFRVYDITVKHTLSYIYLGSPFTENGRMKDVIKLHIKTRAKDLNKLRIFCKKNETMPYIFKKKVLEAMIVSSLLYGCESWLGTDFKEVEKLYVSAVKVILGVRETTRNDASLIEAGMPSTRELIRKRTRTFLNKELNSGRIPETPLMKIYKLCETKRTKGFVFLRNVMNPSIQLDDSVVGKFRDQNSTKARTYREINPELITHKVYNTKEYINERERLSFTRFRLSSHHLKIETGRWARIEREERVCGCGNGVQDEQHVLFWCPKTETERRNVELQDGAYNNIGALMQEMDVQELVSFVHNCMNHFK